ncbi:hypothetical protein RHGRI_015192 [Rhododendron griersonianum]|uniref:Ankyrin repeat protein n=2 Tax=Rhododendron griersonianum TaxID=479676 RepID=A0AAV6KCD9_9ERIC|nr:hypothetical protein RHGRI_015192 [Rhododendron griersonianum]
MNRMINGFRAQCNGRDAALLSGCEWRAGGVTRRLQMESGRFNLLKVAATREELLRKDDGCTILHAAIMGEHYSLAMEIVESFPNLAGALDKNGNTALNMLASKQG